MVTTSQYDASVPIFIICLKIFFTAIIIIFASSSG